LNKERKNDFSWKNEAALGEKLSKELNVDLFLANNIPAHFTSEYFFPSENNLVFTRIDSFARAKLT